MSIEDYAETQKANFQSIKKSPYFRLISLTDQLYSRSIDLVRASSALSHIYAKFILLGHQSLLSAATLIAQGQPHDAAPITRRAIEMARLSLGLKHNNQAYKKWLSYEARAARWQSRQTGKKPEWLPSIKYDLPRDHPILKELAQQLGTLSDGFVHFTPEYFANQNWREKKNTNRPEIQLIYFISDIKFIEGEMLPMAATHARILAIIEECLGYSFSTDSQWKDIRDMLYKDGSELSDWFKARSAQS